MAVSLVGITTGSHASSTVTLSTHASTQIGDIIIAICVRDEGYATASWTGNPFTLLRTLDAGTSTTTGGRIQIWARQATAAGATSYSYVDSGNNSTGCVHLIVVRGAVMPTATNTATQSNATSTTPASPTVGSGTLDMLITGFGVRVNSATRTFGVGASGLTSGGQVTDSSNYYASFAAYGFGVAAGAKNHSLSPTTTTRAAAIYLVASAAASQDVSPSAIASGEAHGSTTVAPGPASATPTGIGSAEAFGTLALAAGAVGVSPSGIASGEAFGTAVLQSTVSPSGIASGESFGTANLQLGNVIAPDGIASAEVVPGPVLTAGPIGVTVGGIASGEAFGAPSVALTVSPSSIGSAEALGVPTLTVGAVAVTATGIPSAEAVGTPALSMTIVVSAIPSAEAFGTAAMAPGQVSLLLVGIPSAEAVGSLVVTVTIDPNRRGGRPVDRTTVSYELVMVARIPSSSGPPALIDIDSVRWRTLNWSSTLSKPQSMTAQVKESTLSEAVAQRLRGPDRLATEFKLLRDGQVVFAGPLRTWRKTGETVEINADGLLSYLQGMIVTSDLRYDQVDQHLIVKDLVDRWQSYFAYTHAGIDTSDIAPSGRLRDGSYAYKEIHVLSRRIEELGAREDGFDHEVDPTTRQLQLWYPRKGIDRSLGADAIVFDDHNVNSLDVMCSVSPDDLATYAFGAGQSSATDGTLWSAYYSDAAASAYGGFALAQSWSDVSEQGTLDDHTLALLRAHTSALFVPGPKARVTGDADLGSYDVGDTVSFESSGVLAVRGAYRIRKRSIQVQEDGTESVDLEFV